MSEKLDAMCSVCCRRRATNGISIGQVPNDKTIVILTAEGGQVQLVERERQGGHRDFVQRQPVDLTSLSEVPDDDISRETHESLLPRGQELSALRDSDAIDLVVVALQKRLRLLYQVPYDNCAAQWKDQVLIVGMQYQA
jgi:hypothetical protein